MSVRFIYVDESFDAKRFCLSAFLIRHSEWRECFDLVRQHRILLKRDHGIRIREEIHAAEFLAGRGNVSDQIITKHQRSRIFEGLLRLVAQLPEVMLFNVCLNQADHKDAQLAAWDRLINRLERTLLAMEERELPLRKTLVSKIPAGIDEEVRSKIETRLVRYRSRAVVVADEGR